MDPVIDNEWFGIKHDPVDETQVVGNIARSWQWRERGINPPHNPPNKTVFENIAEDILVQKPLKIRSCDLPGYPRSTFLMVFSPDGTKVASTHGNHNVYVSELSSGKHVRILKGHPRTPWCIAFHPSHTQLIGSGCLGGQVRVWDIASGGSEVWNVRNETVIASLAFHPREQLLVIATYNELYFWDWSQPAPFTKVSTNNINEKVRYVAFDALGYKLITGISLWACSGMSTNNSLLQQNPMMGPTNNQNNNSRREEPDDSPSANRPPDSPGSAQDMIVNSYQNLVQRYDSLVRNYQRLFMVRHRLTSTPPPPNTIDRGTDPMETDLSPSTSGWTRMASSSSAPPTQLDDANPTPSTSGRQEPVDNGDGENASSRLLNLDVLSFDSDPSRSQNPSNVERSSFGSRASAFQPLNDSGRSFRSGEQNERTRLLPNPFSTSSGSPRPNRLNYSDGARQAATDSTNASRTSIFSSWRPGSSPGRGFLLRRRNFSPLRRENDLSRAESSSTSTETATQSSPSRSASSPSTSRRPTMTNSSTQMSPVTTPLDAQTLTESLDLIRDILRDSGTRLLNLITDMSLSMFVGAEREVPRRGGGIRAHSDDSEGGARPRLDRPRGPRNYRPRPRPRLLSTGWRRELLSSSSDSDSDRSLEVNILRTRNSTFRENDTGTAEPSTASATASTSATALPTDRMVFELTDDLRNEDTSRESGGMNVSLSSGRFRVRTQGSTTGENASAPVENERAASEVRAPPETRTPNAPDFSRPSTSRDNFWTNGRTLPPDEAYRKVRSGVSALQKHTMQLANLWLRGNRTTMRELRIMWENLRRRILMLHRESGRQEVPSYYTSSLIERCMMLADMSDPAARSSGRNSRAAQRATAETRNQDGNRDAPSTSEGTNSTNPTEMESNTSTDNTREPPPGRSPQTRSSTGVRSSSSLRRRLQPNYRWRPDDDLRRRSRTTAFNRLAPRYPNRSRRDITRAIEISATRHEIRMRAMQVLSVMFNMMMMCLEERGLSQLIIIMLRTLKKALALTCFMLVANRNSGRAGSNPAPTPQRVESLDIVRIQNVDHTGPVNVDGPDDQTSLNNAAPPREAPEEDPSRKRKKDDKCTEIEKPSVPKTEPTETVSRIQEEASPPNLASQRWSDRLAVQIADANRNNSTTARNRRELYLESKRMKALHRTNPTAHPLIRKRAMPPKYTYRIPTLRSLPSTVSMTRFATPRIESQTDEPVAGPSNAPPPTENSNPESGRSEFMNEFDHRINFIRIAHMQAIRLRNAARNRFRRLQTIRLYTPSSVREMFSLQNNADNQQEDRSPFQMSPEAGNRRPFAMYRPLLMPRGETTPRPEESNNYHNVLDSAAIPTVQRNDVPPASSDAQRSPPQRLPRIHEYLQPIILAQNAMVVEEEVDSVVNAGGVGGGAGVGGAPRRLGGMAGLLDAGIISDALPAPSHRVQAWDFTTGNTPEIADSTKNVVVQRCRIHNDASIDISKDGRLLVALLPVPRLRNTNHWLGVYSLEWPRLGQCLHTAVLEQSAVSVALSPTARHLAVGLGSRRFTSTPHGRNNVFALLYRLEPLESSSRTGLSPIKELEQNWEHGFTSLNCLRWAPQPGQGLVYANNTGQLIIMS